MSDHSHNSAPTHQHEDEVETGEVFEIHNILAYVSLALGLLCILYWVRFQAFESMPISSDSSLSFVDRVDAWWKEKTGPKELGGVKLGTPKISEPAKPATPAQPANSVIKEAKDYLVATDAQADMVPIPATTKEYPNGYWISANGEYRIGYWNVKGEWKTLHSNDFENGEVNCPDRDWSKPIYAACEKGYKNVTVTIHPPEEE